MKVTDNDGLTASSSKQVTVKECIEGEQAPQSCLIENGTGTQTRFCSTQGNLGDYGTCLVSQCNTGYIKSSFYNQCVLSPKTTSFTARGTHVESYENPYRTCRWSVTSEITMQIDFENLILTLSGTRGASNGVSSIENSICRGGSFPINNQYNFNINGTKQPPAKDRWVRVLGD